MSRQSTKNKKYALRKIGKVFGSCVVATVITLGGVAIMAPNVVHASTGKSGGGHLRRLQIFLLQMMGMKSESLKGRGMKEMIQSKVMTLS